MREFLLRYGRLFSLAYVLAGIASSAILLVFVYVEWIVSIPFVAAAALVALLLEVVLSWIRCERWVRTWWGAGLTGATGGYVAMSSFFPGGGAVGVALGLIGVLAAAGAMVLLQQDLPTFSGRWWRWTGLGGVGIGVVVAMIAWIARGSLPVL